MMIDSAAARWYDLISEAEAVRARTGLGLAGVWGHINADDYPAPRREMDRVLSEHPRNGEPRQHDNH